MFPSCVLPGCRNPVPAVGDACRCCVNAFGPMLKLGARLTAQQIADRDAQVRAAYLRQDTK